MTQTERALQMIRKFKHNPNLIEGKFILFTKMPRWVEKVANHKLDELQETIDTMKMK